MTSTDNTGSVTKDLESLKLQSLTPLELSNSYVPAKYSLDLTINHLKPNFNGQVIIDLIKNDNFNGNIPDHFELSLNCHRLVLTSIELVQESVEPIKLSANYDRINHRVKLTSTTTIVPSTLNNAKVIIKYMGQLNTIKNYNDPTVGMFKTNYMDNDNGRADNLILATHFQPFYAHLVFPLIDELNYKVPIELSITALSKFKVISNESLVSSEIIPMTPNSKFVFKPTPPISPSVFGFVIGDLEHLESLQVENIPVRIYTTIGDSIQASYALKVVEKVLPKLVSLFGPFPLSKFDLVSIPFLTDGAMENWGMVTVLSNQLLIDEHTASNSQKIQVQQLIAHELIHQWLGNLVGFDDFKYLWLNESFATFLGNYIVKTFNFGTNQIDFVESVMDKDGSSDAMNSIQSYMASVDTSITSSTTSSIFETNSYEKGMIILRMVASVIKSEYSDIEDYTPFFNGLKSAIEHFKYKSIKPFDLWSQLNNSTSVDLLSFVHSWLQYEGYPLLKVSYKNDKLYIEQHRFLEDSTLEESNLEDTPFHVPLLIKVQDDHGEYKTLNLLLTDRSIELDIPKNQFVNINHLKGGYYRAMYDFDLDIKRINSIDLISILHDYGKIILKTIHGSTGDLTKSLNILSQLTKKSWTVDWKVLKVALGYLESLNNTLINFTTYEEFRSIWLKSFINELYNKIGNWDSLLNLNHNQQIHSSIELEVRNSVLTLALSLDGTDLKVQSQKFASKLMKNFLNSSKSFIPSQILSSMFIGTIQQNNIKDYKKIMELVKNSNSSILTHTDLNNPNELQTIAVSSLSFVTNEELITKTLNFVMTNIDSKMIELSLIGFQYKSDLESRIKLFNWYKLHYDQWILKSLRKGSDWSKQLGNTMINLTSLIIGDIMQKNDAQLQQLVQQFVALKSSSLPNHGLQELVEQINESNVVKTSIASIYAEVISNFNLS
ncbi:peptidase family M1-domain-containing protein [Scheffersomyces amazonensis]|uniref:peptidase family M1-domain-containing protein n=1 Tax=Scheffersomyces amazonensis TaxID=1078765 RepID=UPI00315CEF1D